LPDGTKNAIRIQRLKDKLGDWSNASSEVEFEGAIATRVGAAGRGISSILEMVALTRLDCIVGSAAIMRQARRSKRSSSAPLRRNTIIVAAGARCRLQVIVSRVSRRATSWGGGTSWRTPPDKC
jgi:hypothetical protein